MAEHSKIKVKHSQYDHNKHKSERYIPQDGAPEIQGKKQSRSQEGKEQQGRLFKGMPEGFKKGSDNGRLLIEGVAHCDFIEGAG